MKYMSKYLIPHVLIQTLHYHLEGMPGGHIDVHTFAYLQCLVPKSIYDLGHNTKSLHEDEQL